MQPEPSQRHPCAMGPYGLLYMSNVTKPPLGGGDSAVCLFQAEGHAFSVLFKSYCLGCSRNSSSWPSLCRARSYRLPYRKDQEAYTGCWKGQLLWRFGQNPNSSGHPTWEWPTDREHLGYVCNPHSLKEGTETSRPSRHSCCIIAELPGHRLSSSVNAWINAVHLLPLILMLWSVCKPRTLKEQGLHT